MLAQVARSVVVVVWASLGAEEVWAREAASLSLLWVAYALHQSLAGHLLRPTWVLAILRSPFARPSAGRQLVMGISSFSWCDRRGPSHSRDPAPHLAGSLPRF